MKNFGELEKLIKILKKKRMKVCIAESLTGGQVAYSFVKKEGASEIFDFSIVCYSNDSKRTFFNADKVIKKYGVVSTETANIMLNKIQKFTSSKKRFLLPVYLIIMCYLFIEIIFSEKSIFKFINNSDLIKKKSDNLSKKKLIEKELTDFMENFKNNKESRKLIVKEKLFYKEKDEKIIRYKIID